jgi:hypothetical protein
MYVMPEYALVQWNAFNGLEFKWDWLYEVSGVGDILWCGYERQVVISENISEWNEI